METVEASDYIFKVIAVGEASVGKTSLCLRYATNKFEENYKMTLGLSLTNKNVILDYDGEEITVQLSIWDTGGQVSFAPLLPMYYKGAMGALIVFDLTAKKTFEKVLNWVEDVREHCEEVPLVIIGNKADLEDDIVISKKEGKELVETIRSNWGSPIVFYETSAKEDIKVDEAFASLSKAILEIVDEEDDVEAPEFARLQNKRKATK